MSCGLALCGQQQARATHILGGQLTYVNVGPNQYVVTLSLYRDCSGAGLPGSMTLTVRPSTSCTATPAPAYPMNAVPNSRYVGSQYCPAQQQQAQCTSAGTLPNFESEQYRTATITVLPGQWTMSTEICCRPYTANLVGQGNFRYEAQLNNRIVVNGQNVDIQNSSAQYSLLDIPVPFVYVNQRTTIGFNTTDPNNTPLAPDTDSLVYSLVAPLDQCNVPVVYKPYPNNTIAVVPGSNPPCYILPPTNTPANYTPMLPMPLSFSTTGVCPVLQGVNSGQFVFDASAGYFTFTPSSYVNSAPSAGDNKYVVVGKVDEYRRLPGFGNRRFLVGSVRREIVIIIINGTNSVPSPPTASSTPGSGTTTVSTADSLFITIQPCNYSRVLLRFTDPDPQDLLTVIYTGQGDINTDILQSGDIGSYSLSGNGTAQPRIRFDFQPSPSHAGRVLRIPFVVLDNACPVLGFQTKVLVVRIAQARRDLATIAVTGGSSGSSSVTTNLATACQGGSLMLHGLISRPDSVRNGLQTYSYAWTGAGIVGTSNTRSITVAPQATTRYRLNVTPNNGFQQGVCGDTASVLIQVAPQPPTPNISRSGAMLVSSAATGNQWFINNSAISGATGNTLTPSVSGSYTVAVRTGSGAVQCESGRSAAVAVSSTRQPLPGSSLRIVPNPTPDGHLTVLLSGYRQATTLVLFDVLGRPVQSAAIASPNAQGTSFPLDLSLLPAGVYVLRVSTAGGVDVCRIVRE
ncbi:hypothetical protein GCM10023185_05080 [Hymenobacter saemangeumensis]|uniref:T9SS type A sorting domain-containing protein n=2 Tax=Hymenobacter saemangeumensis TaxID=1084522 RepID=A0ABP8I0U9_9BACT